MEDTFVRILRPVSRDCMLPRKSYKRSRREQTKWLEGVVEKGARRWLTARRRHCPQAGMGEQARDESNKPREVLEATPQFGGSGARFATLRNRRGVLMDSFRQDCDLVL